MLSKTRGTVPRRCDAWLPIATLRTPRGHETAGASVLAVGMAIERGQGSGHTFVMPSPLSPVFEGCHLWRHIRQPRRADPACGRTIWQPHRVSSSGGLRFGKLTCSRPGSLSAPGGGPIARCDRTVLSLRGAVRWQRSVSVVGATRLMDCVYGTFTDLRPPGAGADCEDGWLKSRADVVGGGDESGGNLGPSP